MTIPLRFQQVGSYPYPVPTNGSGTAMTACRRNNDPALAFLTQTGQDDEIVFLHLHLAVSVEDGRVPTPPNRWIIQGLCYQKSTDRLWASENFTASAVGQHGLNLIAVDPSTGAEVQAVGVSGASGKGLAFNGAFFVRSDGSTLAALTLGGASLGSTPVPAGATVHGLAAAGAFYVAADKSQDRLLVLGPFGGLVAECTSVPGTAGGMEAVAYDNISDFQYLSQIPTANGAPGPVGSLEHPDTPWNPSPWLRRHNIYIANETDQTIYFGYLWN